MIGRSRRPSRCAITAAGVALALLASACGAGDQTAGKTTAAVACDHTKPAKAVTINVLAYDSPAIDSFTDPMVKSCSTDNVTIKHVPIDFNGQYTKTPITLAAKSGTYDIVEFYTGAVAQYASKKQIIPLDTLFAKYTKKYGLDGLNPTFLNAMKYGGKLYALPTQVNVGVMAYRKDIFTKLGLSAPTTYAELAADAKKIQKAGLVKYPIAYPASDPSTAYEQTLGSLGHTSYLDASGKPTFATANARKALTALTNLTPYLDPQASTFDSTAVQQQLYNGKAAIALKFSGSMSDLLNPANSRYAKDFAVVAPPSVEPGGYSASSLSADGWAIAANSKVDPDLLFQIMAASVSTKISTAAMPAAYPARTSVITTAKLPYAGAVQGALAHGALAAAPYPWFTQMEDASYTPLLKAISGKLTVAKALQSSQAAAVKALNAKLSAILTDAVTTTAPPPVRRSRRRPRRSGTTLRRIDAATMLTPCLVVMLGLLTLPLIQTAVWSFQRASYSGSSGWVGLDNYRRAIEDPDFRAAVGFTVCFAVVQTVAIVVIGYILAALLNRVRRMRSLYLGILLVPFVVPSVIASTAFGWLFDDNFGGVANQILDHLIGRTFDWFSGTWPNRFLILADVVWMSAPFAMIVFLAAMKGVPTELVEAAELDGANWWQRHRHVVYPGIRPMIVFVTMISTMDGLRLFDPLIPLSRAAAANGNLSVELYVYQHAFARANQDVGLGSAINVMMILLMLPLVLPMVRATRRAS